MRLGAHPPGRAAQGSGTRRLATTRAPTVSLWLRALARNPAASPPRRFAAPPQEPAAAPTRAAPSRVRTLAKASQKNWPSWQRGAPQPTLHHRHRHHHRRLQHALSHPWCPCGGLYGRSMGWSTCRGPMAGRVHRSSSTLACPWEPATHLCGLLARLPRSRNPACRWQARRGCACCVRPRGAAKCTPFG